MATATTKTEEQETAAPETKKLHDAVIQNVKSLSLNPGSSWRA